MSSERLDPKIVKARKDVARRMSRGGTVDDVDAEIIEPSDFSADEKAALWLYAWSYVPCRAQRRSADLQLLLAASRL